MKKSLMAFAIFLTFASWAEAREQSFEMVFAEMAPEHMKEQPVSGIIEISDSIVSMKLKAANPDNNLEVVLPLVRRITSRCDVVYTVGEQADQKVRLEIWEFSNTVSCFGRDSGKIRVSYTTVENQKQVLSQMLYQKVQDDLASNQIRCVQAFGNMEWEKGFTLLVKKEDSGKYFIQENKFGIEGAVENTFPVRYYPPSKSDMTARYRGQEVLLKIDWESKSTDQGFAAIYTAIDHSENVMRCKNL